MGLSWALTVEVALELTHALYPWSLRFSLEWGSATVIVGLIATVLRWVRQRF